MKQLSHFLVSFFVIFAWLTPSVLWANTFLDAFTRLDHEWNMGEGHSKGDNLQGNLGWGEGYLMMSYMELYRSTKDLFYLRKLIEHAENVIDQRDDNAGRVDYRGISGPTWVSVRYSLANYAWVVHSGMITYPMVDFAQMVINDPSLQMHLSDSGFTFLNRAEWLVDRVRETIEAHEDQWIEAVGNYRTRDTEILENNQNIPLPVNMFAAMGRTLLMMYLATNEPQYLDRTITLASKFKARLDLVNNSYYIWNYGNTDRLEDTSHATIEVDFALLCHKYGIIFNETDMHRFASTLKNGIYLNPLQFADAIDGTGTVNSYLGSVSLWVDFSTYDRDLYHILADNSMDDAFFTSSTRTGDRHLSLAKVHRYRPLLNPISVDRSAGSASQWAGVAAGDFDGNGIDEFVAVRNFDGRIYLYGWVGDHVQITASSIAFGSNSQWAGIAAGDFDGDGKDEFVAVRNFDGHFYVFEVVNGQIQFITDHPAFPFSQWADVAAGDFDNDGKDEFVAVRNLDGNFFIYKMIGNQVEEIATYTNFGVDSDWAGIAAADFDNDNADEFVAMRNFDGNFYMLELNGGNIQNVAANTDPGSASQWNAIAAGDFDGDGNQEFMAQRNFDGDIYTYYLENGEIKQTPSREFMPANFDIADMAMGRLRDPSTGKDDLIIFRNFDGDVFVYDIVPDDIFYVYEPPIEDPIGTETIIAQVLTESPSTMLQSDYHNLIWDNWSDGTTLNGGIVEVGGYERGGPTSHDKEVLVRFDLSSLSGASLDNVEFRYPISQANVLAPSTVNLYKQSLVTPPSSVDLGTVAYSTFSGGSLVSAPWSEILGSHHLQPATQPQEIVIQSPTLTQAVQNAIDQGEPLDLVLAGNFYSHHAFIQIDRAPELHFSFSQSTGVAGGTVSPSGYVNVNEGSNQTFTITPDPGFSIKEILVDGAPVTLTNSYTFNNVTANHSLLVTFQADADVTMCTNTPSDLIAWWPFDEFSGASTTELIHGNSGALMNAPVLEPTGKVDAALSFDGANDHVIVQHDNTLNFGSSDFTIEAWLNPESPGAVVGKYGVTATGPKGYDLILANSSDPSIFNVGFFFNADMHLGLCQINRHEWSHLVVVVRNTAREIRCYVNGVLMEAEAIAVASSSVDNTEPVMIGLSNFGWGAYRGFMDELSFYKRALSETEIQSIVDADHTGKCKNNGATSHLESFNYDARIEHNEGFVVPPTPTQQAAESLMQQEMAFFSVDYEASTGSPRVVYNPAGYLTAPSLNSAESIALDYIHARLNLLGLVTADLNNMELTDYVFTQVTGANRYYYRQVHQGLSLYNGQILVTVNRDGRVLNLNNAFMPNIANAVNTTTPVINAAEAVRSALSHLDITSSLPNVLSGPTGTKQETAIDPQGISLMPIDALLMLLPIRAGDVRLVWNFQVATLDSQHVYDFTIDAVSGKVWTRFDWVDADSYRVYPPPIATPNHSMPAAPSDGRDLVTPTPAPLASPYGWHDTNGLPGADFQIMKGNNVHAYADTNNDDSPPLFEPSCGPLLNCDFPLNLNLAPHTYTHASVANAFFWSNYIHDVQFQYGFDQLAGNFQDNFYFPYSGNKDEDPLMAEVQDAGGRNNAIFFTPPDGQSPRMQLYLWHQTLPSRASSLSNATILHEYAHGISNRQVGGPSNTSCLQNRQQPGEGISDLFYLMYTHQAGDAPEDPKGFFTYVRGEPIDGAGVRPQPYSTSHVLNTYRYDSMDGLTVPHGVGSVWAQVAWEVYWELVEAHGFDPNLYDVNGGSGNQRMMLYVNEGLKNTSCNPTFTEARDAIIQAVIDNYNGEDLCRVWIAFHKFGMGLGAISGGSNSTSPTNGFGTPGCIFS